MLQHRTHQSNRRAIAARLPGKPMQCLEQSQWLARDRQLGNRERFCCCAGVGQHFPAALNQPGLRLPDIALLDHQRGVVRRDGRRMLQQIAGNLCQRWQRGSGFWFGAGLLAEEHHAVFHSRAERRLLHSCAVQWARRNTWRYSTTTLPKTEAFGD